MKHKRYTEEQIVGGCESARRRVGAALVLPRCNTEAMQRHLEEGSILFV